MTKVAEKPAQAAQAGGQGRPPASPRQPSSSQPGAASEQETPGGQDPRARGTEPRSRAGRGRGATKTYPCGYLSRDKPTDCGRPHHGCSGHSKQKRSESGEPLPCGAPRGAGTDHSGTGNCKNHTGSVRNGRKAAQKEGAELALEMLGIAIPIDPITGLRTAIWEAWGNVTFLRHQCQTLGIELVGNVMAATRDGDLYATSEEARAMVRLYGEWHDRFTKACVAAAKIGLAEAEIQLARQHAALVAEIVFGVIEGLKLPPRKADEARALFGREFRRVAPSLGTVEMS